MKMSLRKKREEKSLERTGSTLGERENTEVKADEVDKFIDQYGSPWTSTRSSLRGGGE